VLGAGQKHGHVNVFLYCKGNCDGASHQQCSMYKVKGIVTESECWVLGKNTVM